LFKLFKRKKTMKIKASDLIADKIKENPELKERLMSFSPLFEKLQDAWVFNIIANIATFEQLAKYSGVNINDLIKYLETGEKNAESSGMEKETKPEWVENGKFVEIDARKLSGFFLKDILAVESKLQPGEGLKVVQNFLAAPLITLLESKGYKSFSEKIDENLYNIYFIKTARQEDKQVNLNLSGKPTMVIQSATPVVYPVLLKLLQSERVKKSVEVTEYKVWEETEKHLGWIVNGKADLSFSAILAMSNLASNKDIVKLTSVTVWDNFYLLTRGYHAENWDDVRNHEIHNPLFFNAPPAKVTHYLMREAGYEPKEFKFVYGKPFGRPEKIYKDLVEGKIDTALLREPEVSYALVNNPQISVAFSYSDLWIKNHKGSHGLPNAGVVFKREWFEKYPDEAQILMEEIDNAVNWVRENPQEAAKLSYEEMGHSYEEVLRFLTRVRYENIPAEEVEKEIVDYLSLIDGEEKARLAIGKMLYRKNASPEIELTI